MKKGFFIYFILVVMGLAPGILFPGNINIAKVGEWGTGSYRDVFVHGNNAFCLYNGGIDIFDTNDPKNPLKIGSFDTFWRPYSIYVSGNYAYIAAGTYGLQILDVSYPFNPVLVGNYRFDGGIYDVIVKGCYAYLGCGGKGLRIIDVSNPSAPFFVGAFTGDRVESLFVKGNYAYIEESCYTPGRSQSNSTVSGVKGSEETWFRIIDVSVPSAPKKVGTYYSYIGEVTTISTSRNYAYLLYDYSRLEIIDISNPSDPILVGSCFLTGYNYPEGFFVLGNYAYIVLGEEGLRVVDVSDPTAPLEVGGFHTPGSAFGVYVKGNYAYIADLYKGLQVLNVSNPRAPLLMGHYDMSGYSMDVHCMGNYSYLLRSDGLYVMDVSDPSSPILTAYFEISGKTNYYKLYVSGKYAYVTVGIHGNDALMIIDISVPSSPTLVGTWNFSSWSGPDVYVSGNYAYLAINDVGLQIVDVSNPFLPVLVGTWFSDYAHEVYVHGNYAYVSCWSPRDLVIIDVSDPSSPTLVGECATSENINDIFVSGNYAYLGIGTLGLEIVDISNPYSPELLGRCDTPAQAQGVYVKGNDAYVADGESGVMMIDISIPSSPKLAAYYNTTGNSAAVFVNGNYIYTADGSSGKLLILKAYDPAEVPRLNLDRTKLSFASTNSGSGTGSQSFFISNSSQGTLNWTVSVDRNWLICLPLSGTNNGEVTVEVDTSTLHFGTYFGTITVTDPAAVDSPQMVAVTLEVYGYGQSSEPFGVFSTPTNGSVVSGSIPVTGWVLDDIGVRSVQLFREDGDGESLVYIGDAVFVEGARPDVEQAYPWYPMNYKAGWGYMMLTNFLPNEGNGTFKIHAIATDLEGNQVTLGTKTIICDNANGVKPFGTIDTPKQGGTASGKDFVNFGWALTPPPNTIPTDGSTINVWVDGVSLGNPLYNRYREDIAALFPGYNNSNGAGGYFYLDTTPYENGVHTIQWTVTDDAGNTDGIGSRYFSILNNPTGAGSRGQSAWCQAQSFSFKTPDVSNIPIDYSEPLRVKKGYNPDVEPQILYPDENGQITIEIKELERVEIQLSTSHWTGFQVIGSQLRSLPIGSFLDPETGLFSWTPGPGHYGLYTLFFINKEMTSPGEGKNYHVQIEILPRFEIN